MVNQFIEKNHFNKIISVSDANTTDETGATIGLIRVIAYEQNLDVAKNRLTASLLCGILKGMKTTAEHTIN